MYGSLLHFGEFSDDVLTEVHNLQHFLDAAPLIDGVLGLLTRVDATAAGHQVGETRGHHCRRGAAALELRLQCHAHGGCGALDQVGHKLRHSVGIDSRCLFHKIVTLQLFSILNYIYHQLVKIQGEP